MRYMQGNGNDSKQHVNQEVSVSSKRDMEQKLDEAYTVVIFLDGKAKGIKIPEVLIEKVVVNRRGSPRN